MTFECHWNKSTTLAFLQSIREEPIIWDALHPHNKNRLERHRAIERIGNLMGISIEEVNKKWSSLRGQYVREKRKKPDGSSKWFAYDEMEMLYLNKVDPDPDPLSGYDQEYPDEEMLSDSSCSSPPPTIPIPTLVPQKFSVEVPMGTQKQNITVKTEPRPKIQIAPSPKIQISNPPVQIAPRPTPQITPQIVPQSLPIYKILDSKPTPPKEDDISIFGAYVAAQLRQFKPKLQSKAKLEICKLLYSMEMENLNDDSRGYCNSPDMSTSDHNY